MPDLSETIPQLMLEARDLTLSYGQTRALNEVSMSVASGESVAVMGASGSGKSSLLHCLAGVIAPNSGSVHIDDYLRDLCVALEETATADRRVTFACDAERAPINRDKAIVIGLLVNEVATNSIKHAFGENRGRISVRFRPENGRHVLSISDDGRGISDDAGDGGRPGLGMRLIEALAQQGNGTVERTTGPGGTTFTITFNG